MDIRELLSTFVTVKRKINFKYGIREENTC